MRVLGIESSCNELPGFAGAGRSSDFVQYGGFQVKAHSPYGGVVPELASRQHVEAILPVIQEALSRAGFGLADVDAIAVTQGPGLVGSLLVGIGVAKSMAYVLGIPWVGVNHIFSHVAAIFLESPVSFPLSPWSYWGSIRAFFR